jgi:hypothetical protein
MNQAEWNLASSAASTRAQMVSRSMRIWGRYRPASAIAGES